MNRFFAPLLVLFMVALLVTLHLTGCRLFGHNPGGPETGGINAAGTPLLPVTVPTTARVSFRVVLPTTQASGSIHEPPQQKPHTTELEQPPLPEIAAVIATTPPTVTFKLILVNVGNGSQTTTTLTKTVPVIYPSGSTTISIPITGTVPAAIRLSTGGYAEAAFTGVPALPCIGDIHIDGGNISGYTDFHGAADLIADKENTVAVSPKGSKTIADVLAVAVHQIVDDATNFAKATLGFVTKVADFILNLDPASPTAATDAVTAFVNSTAGAGFLDATLMKNGIWIGYAHIKPEDPTEVILSAKLWDSILNNKKLNMVYLQLGEIEFPKIRSSGLPVDRKIFNFYSTTSWSYANPACQTKMRKLVSGIRAKGKKVLAWIGSSPEDATATPLIQLGSDIERHATARICREVCDLMGFDGIQLNIEGAELVAWTSSNGIPQLLTDIRKEIGPVKFLSLAGMKFWLNPPYTGPNLWATAEPYRVLNESRMAGNLDQLVLMEYDYGPSNFVPVADFYRDLVATTVAELCGKEGFPLAIGLPLYQSPGLASIHTPYETIGKGMEGISKISPLTLMRLTGVSIFRGNETLDFTDDMESFTAAFKNDAQADPLPVAQYSPDRPTINGITPGDGAMTVSWGNVTGAATFNIYFGPTAAGHPRWKGTRLEGITSPIQISALLNGTNYSLVVTAVNSIGESLESSISSVTPQAATTTTIPPAPPTGVDASDGAFPNTIKVTWNTVASATSYEIWRNTSDLTTGAIYLGTVTTNVYWDDSTGTNYPSQGDTTYYYWIKSVKGTQKSDYSDSNSGYWSSPPPPAPNGVDASDGGFANTIKVTWIAISSATSYEVWRNTTDSTTGANYIGTVTTNVYWDDSTGTNYPSQGDTTYYYWIKSVKGTQKSDYSGSNSGYWSSPPPPAPNGVDASDGGFANTIKVTWIAISSATSYEVWRNTANSTTGATYIGTVTTNVYWDDSTRANYPSQASTTYYYWIKTVKGATKSIFSSSNSGFWLPPPPAPTGVDVSDGYDDIRISWIGFPGVGAYEIWRNTSNVASEAIIIKTVLVPLSSTDMNKWASDKPPQADTTYYYWVKTIEVTGRKSDFSSSDSGYWTPPPSAPTGIDASDGLFPDTIKITWDAVNNATSYEIWRASPTESETYVGAVATNVYWDDSNKTNYPPQADITYRYYIKTIRGNQKSGFPSISDSGYWGNPPPAPTGVDASDGDYLNTIRVAWIGVANATSYEIWRNTTNYLPSATYIGTVTTNVYWDDSTGVSYPSQADTVYYYWIKTIKGSQRSDFSSSNSGYWSSPPPPAPTGVDASDGSFASTIKVAWNAVTDATSYEIWRNTSDTTAGATFIGTVTTNAYWDDSTGTNYPSQPNRTYFYWIKTVIGTRKSDFSLSNSGIWNLNSPGIPQNCRAIGGSGSVTVSWDSIPEASAYNVYYIDRSGAAAWNLPIVSKTNYVSFQQVTNNSCVFSGLTNGLYFVCAVTAINVVGESELSAQVWAPPNPGRCSRDTNGIITDSQTGLQWLEGTDQSTTWSAANNWITALGNGWRMPTRAEVHTLWVGLDSGGGSDRVLDPYFFTNAGYVWCAESNGGVLLDFSGAFDYPSSFGGEQRRGFAVRAP